MIKFFRKIRQNLLMESKTGKYFKYAIGEIFLVMIGILLALQVSNWNQKRIDSQKEQLLLSELHEEFLNNQKQLEEVLDNHKIAMKNTRYAIAQFPINPNEIDLDTFYTNMIHFGRRFTFNPSQGVIKSLVNSSSFDIISNPELRKLLVSWEDVLADYTEEENTASISLRDVYIPRILNKLSWKTFKDERIDITYLSSLEFENIFYSRENELIDILESDSGELELIQETINKINQHSKPKD
jgi:hypothetical protein